MHAVTTLGLVGALVVGAIFGYGAQRGAFCMNSGFRGAVEGDWTKLKALALAVAVQLLLLPAIFATRLARPADLPLLPLGAVVGGLLFGFSMRWAGGCAAGVWYKLGAGDVGALLAILGMALGALASDSGPLAGARVSLQQAVPSAAPWRPPFLASVAVGVFLLLALTRLAPGRAGAWTWQRTGLWIGATAALAWPLSAAAGRDFGLAIVPGTTAVLSAVAGHPFSAWDALLVLGILIGGWLAARQSRPTTQSAASSVALLKRFAGGLGLGIGASIATGCTVGQGLTGLALLAPSSLVVMASIFGGSTVATLLARRLQSVSRPIASSSTSP
jgi:uncharacterized membrane protein YedE/YeeE